MTLKIEQVRAHLAETPVGFTYSSGSLTVGRALIWEIVAGGHVGLGECTAKGVAATPSLNVVADDAGRLREGGTELLGTMAGGLIGRDATQLEALLPELPPVMDRDLCVAREGLSIALYDLVGKARGVPVHLLLGGKRRDRSPGMPVIHVAPPEVMARRSKAWVDAGYQYVKVKFRGELEEDVDALRAIRKAIGDDVPIQVDANDGYKELDPAVRAIRALESCNVECFEDMLDASLAEIAELRRVTGVKIMVDKQGSWPLVYDACQLGAADVINHHPNNQGGLATALRIDAVATAAGLTTSIGSSGLFGIQDAAFQVLSSVISLTRPCEDIGIVPYYSGPTKGEYDFDREPTVVKEPYPIVDGVIQVPDRPGLGIELDRTRLEEFTVSSVVFD